MEDVELPVGDTLLHSKVVHYIKPKRRRQLPVRHCFVFFIVSETSVNNHAPSPRVTTRIQFV